MITLININTKKDNIDCNNNPKFIVKTWASLRSKRGKFMLEAKNLKCKTYPKTKIL